MIANRMKFLVNNSGKSQTVIAEKLGISQPRLNQYLNGKREPDYAFLVKFCRYFDTTPNYLFNFSSDDLNEPILDCAINIIKNIEIWANEHKIFYSPEAKAELFRLIFKKMYNLPEKQLESKIPDFLEVYETVRKSL